MKQLLHDTQPKAADRSGPRYWRSLDDLAGTPGFQDWVEREFTQGASELTGVNRRHFLKIMAASFALAGFGMGGCRRPERKILPYSRQPEQIVPGVPLYYSSSLPDTHDNLPLIVETHEARPTKIEGNPSYQLYGGATDAFAQASVLDLYDPDRAQGSRRGAKALSRLGVADALTALQRRYTEKKGKGLALILKPSTSPTRARLLSKLRKNFPEGLIAEYAPIDYASPKRALYKVFGTHVRPYYHLKKAKRVLALDADFLHSEPGHLGYARDFAQARRVRDSKDVGKMNRLYSVESTFTLTGGMADHRVRISTSEMPSFAARLAAEVLKIAGGQSDLLSTLESRLAQESKGLKIDPAWIRECAQDLVEHRGASLIIAGSHLPEEVHLVTAFLNRRLAAVGKTLSYLEVTEPIAKDAELKELKEVSAAIKTSAVETLVIVEANPAYDAPAELDWSELQRSVPEVVRFGYYADDETSRKATTFIAATHYLESWGDVRTWDGTLVPVQPMILPLFKEAFSEIELLAHLAGVKEPNPYTLVRETFFKLSGNGTAPVAFDKWLAEGLLTKSGYRPVKDAVEAKWTDALQASLAQPQPNTSTLGENHLEVRFVPSNSVGSGQYSNNGWMQECPDPMTKLAWDNAILVSPLLAKELDIIPAPIQMNTMGKSALNANHIQDGKEESPIGELKLGATSIQGPVHIQPGLANYTVVLPLGYGRQFGRVAKGVGFDAYPLRNGNSLYATGASLRLTGATYQLANTQEHWSMEGRAIIREANAKDYVEHPDFTQKMGIEAHSPPIYGKDSDKPAAYKATTIPRGNSAYKTPEFTALQQWGMSIDLNSCTGCNACVIACQSENNIPIVGKDQVIRGREMHWIRLDRYYSSGVNEDGEVDTMEIPEDPQVSFQSMACVHCELAPCETVCPVNATVHDEQGLNVMAYNRCIGTRYCANNCPYKVRRFNFFDWNKRQIGHFYEGPLGPDVMPELEKMQKNPDVTVRMRGVMEKCTYCVQRIEEAKIDQKIKARDSDAIKVPDGRIQTACQQVCPTDAIIFGDIADPETAVSRLKASDRDYSVLGYLNTRPRTTYLAKLRNPNPKMPDYAAQPLSRIEYEARNGHGHESAHGTPH